MQLVLFDNLIKYFLVLVRVSGFFITIPVFSSRTLPIVAKIGLSLTISMLLMPVLDLKLFYVPDGTLKFGGVVLSEIFLGVLMGFLSSIIIEGFRLAGEIVGVQLGFGMVSVLDPESTTQDSMMDVFLFFIFLMIFLTMDFHHKFLIAMYDTFQKIPVGHLIFPKSLFKDLIYKLSVTFVLSMKIAFPLIAPGIIIIVILGIVSKTVPRMEVFLISFPLKIFLGFMMIVMLLPYLPWFTNKMIDTMFKWIYSYMNVIKW